MRPPTRPERAFLSIGKARAKALAGLLALVGLFLVWRLYVIQIRDGPQLARMALEQHLMPEAVPARRGTIYDSDGYVLARSLSSRSVYATRSQVHDVLGTARALAPVLHHSVGYLLEQLAGPGEYVAVERKIPRDAAERIGKLDLPGIYVVPEETGERFVPGGRLASTVLGFTGIDDNGLDGIEYEYDDLLRGRAGEVKFESDEDGRALPFAQLDVVRPASEGHDVVLTIDSYLQFDVERILAETLARWHARDGTAIVMDPDTGALLAIANAPDYDVNRFATSSADERRDRAVSDAYEPGSTFKLITAAAALESGRVDERSRFPSLDELRVGGRVIHNAEDGFLGASGGSETLEDIIAYSHNVGAAEVAQTVGPSALYHTIRDFGFGDATRAGLPGENPGIVPDLAQWSGSSLATIAFGHGVAVTPLAMVRAYAAIANGGTLLRPRILGALLAPDGSVLYRYGREEERRVLSPRVDAILKRYLRAVVVRGTGNPTAQVAGYTSAGKTGTAQIAQDGRYLQGEYIASFIGYVPAEHPRFVILVKIDRPQGAIYGSVVAAPAFAQIARAALLHVGIAPHGERLVRTDPPSKART